MSLSISGTAFPQKDSSYEAADSHSSSAVNSKETPSKPTQTIAKHNQVSTPPTPPPAKLTEEQQVQQLLVEGQSTQQIATVLGLTVTQVEQSLAGTSAAASSASSVVALSGRLSISV